MIRKILVFTLPVLLLSTVVFAQEQKILQDSMQYYFNKGNFVTAIFWAEKNVAALKQKVAVTDTSYIAAMNNLGESYFSNGNYKEAKTTFKEVITIIKNKEGEKSAAYAMQLDNLGNVAEKLAEWADAENYFLSAVKIQKEISGEDNVAYANYITSLAVLYRLQSKYTEAESLYLKAGAIFKNTEGEESADYLTFKNNLAGLYYATGKLALAEKTFIETAAIKRKVFGAESFDYGHTLSNLGVVYYVLGNFLAAETVFDKAISIFEKTTGDKNPQYALTEGLLASTYQQLLEYSRAEKLIRHQMSVNEITVGKNSAEYATSLNNLAFLYIKSGKDSATEMMLKESLETRRKLFGTNNTDYAITLNNLALYYTRKKSFTVADSLYKEALSVRKNISGETNQDYINLISNQCELYLLTKNYAAASKAALKNLAVEEFLLLNKLDFLTESQLIAHVKNNETPFSMPYSSLAHYNLPDLLKAAYNNRLLINGIAIQNTSVLSKEMLQSKDSITVNLWKNYKSNKSLLNKTLTQPVTARVINSDSLADVTIQQEKDLMHQSESFRNIKEKFNITWQDVRNNLAPAEAAIEFIRFKEIGNDFNYNFYYAAMVLRPKDSVPVFIKLFEESALKAALKSFAYKEPIVTRSGKPINKIPSTKNTTSGVYHLIWQPLEPYLSNVTTVYFAPDGLLHNIAFAAIPGKNGSVLCDTYSLIQVTSTRQVAIKDTYQKPPASIALFGGIDYNKQSADTAGIVKPYQYSYVYQQSRSSAPDSFVYLPGTLKEVAGIKKNMDLQKKNVSFYIGDKATEAAFRSLDGEASPEVIHFATHGFTIPDTATKKNIGSVFKISDNPLLRSGLVLAGGNKGWKGRSPAGEDDGILTALEITAASLPNTQLAVLSACETGTGELRGSEGVFGLQRAFKIAGVNYIMASLWQVPDKETAEFMHIFYSNRLAGKSTRQAFLTTQQFMRKKYPPYYWAAFTLVQ
ncbi:CHAT domain-containing protein [Ferruginibacter sp. SUN106]|uniref:CHAT domain-containing protein n=1 Tax=Ferruginibacter sp. SUN106 TaxID=2978348 RepID=UPI003D3650F2